MGKKNVKFTMDEIYAFGTKYNIKFCDDIYINNNHSHNWFCNIHKEKHSRSLDKIRSRHGLKCCCAERKIAKNKREIKKIEIEQDLCLLSEYHARHIPLMWKCNKHNKIFRKSLQVIRKSPLPECCKREEKIALIEKVIKPLGYELLDNDYSGKTHTWHCIHHNKTYYNKWTTYLAFEKGQLLKCCANEKNSGQNHPNYNCDVSDEQRVNDRRAQRK